MTDAQILFCVLTGSVALFGFWLKYKEEAEERKSRKN